MMWFREWIGGHIARHAALGLPAYEDATDIYEGWLASFQQFRVTRDEAEAASIDMVSMDVSKAKHFSTLSGLIAKAKAARKATISQSSLPTVDCDICGGSGSVSVVEAEPEPYDRSAKPTFHACCVCEAGEARRDMLARSFGDGRYILMLSDVRADKCFPVRRGDGTIEKVWYDEIHDIDADYAGPLPGNFRAVLERRQHEALTAKPPF